jgi:hypothetical protein
MQTPWKAQKRLKRSSLYGGFGYGFNDHHLYDSWDRRLDCDRHCLGMIRPMGLPDFAKRPSLA